MANTVRHVADNMWSQHHSLRFKRHSKFVEARKILERAAKELDELANTSPGEFIPGYRKVGKPLFSK